MTKYIYRIRACDFYCSKLLTKSHYSSFWNISSIQHVASTIAFKEPKQPDIVWREDMTGLSHCETVVDLKSLRSGLHNINDRLAQLLSEISGGKLLPCSPPENYSDPMSKEDVGYTFLNHQSLSQHHLKIVKYMLENTESKLISTKTSSNELILSTVEMIHILEACAEINKLLMILMHMVCSQPPRASEEVDLRIQNGHRHRNIFLVFGKIWRVVAATKTENLTGHSDFIPALLPSEIGQHLLYYLVHIWPLEILLAEQVYGQEAKSLYHDFLYVQKGKRVTPDQLSKAMFEETTRYCGVSLKVSNWRHIAISLMRRFIITSLHPPSHTKPTQNIGDLAAAHTTATAQQWYGRDVATLPNVPQDVMDAYQAFCKHWHAVLEFGDLPCPTPVVQQLEPQNVVSQTSTIEKLLKELREIREENKKNMETVLKKLSETEEENKVIKGAVMELLQEVRLLKTQRVFQSSETYSLQNEPPLSSDLDDGMSEGAPSHSEEELEYD